MRLAKRVAGAACVAAAALAAGCGDDPERSAGASVTTTAAAGPAPKAAGLRKLCARARSQAPRGGAAGVRARYRAQAGAEILIADAMRAGGAQRSGTGAGTLLTAHEALAKSLTEAATGSGEPDPFTRKQIRFLAQAVEDQAQAARLPECASPPASPAPSP